MLSQIDPYDEELLPNVRNALIEMLRKQEDYVWQGRARDAHGAGTMIWILWTHLNDTPNFTDPTNFDHI
jgi:hypothetical protein